jgi:hypothetical protein
MIKVYFESGSHAECVATFMDEATYMACLPTLEQIATAQGMHVTESEVDIQGITEGAQEMIDLGSGDEKAQGHAVITTLKEVIC